MEIGVVMAVLAFAFVATVFFGSPLIVIHFIHASSDDQWFEEHPGRGLLWVLLVCLAILTPLGMITMLIACGWHVLNGGGQSGNGVPQPVRITCDDR